MSSQYHFYHSTFPCTQISSIISQSLHYCYIIIVGVPLFLPLRSLFVVAVGDPCTRSFVLCDSLVHSGCPVAKTHKKRAHFVVSCLHCYELLYVIYHCNLLCVRLYLRMWFVCWICVPFFLQNTHAHGRHRFLQKFLNVVVQQQQQHQPLAAGFRGNSSSRRGSSSIIGAVGTAVGAFSLSSLSSSANQSHGLGATATSAAAVSASSNNNNVCEHTVVAKNSKWVEWDYHALSLSVYFVCMRKGAWMCVCC